MTRLRSERPILLDVSRLVWRVWRGNLPTGIDRVCLAYVQHFRSRSQAVLQRKGLRVVLSPADSDRLFEALLTSGSDSRARLLRLAVRAAPAAVATKPVAGSIYLNVGHTGLDEPSLTAWIERHHLRAVYLVHDLIPLTHPQYCRPGENEKHARRMATVLASATGVIANSQATLDELAQFAHRQGESIPRSVVAFLGNEFRTPDVAKPTSRPHFITVGTIEGRKNHQLLLEVWHKLFAALGEDAPVLLIVGQRGWQAEEVFRQLDHLGDLQGRVRELNSCTDPELVELISQARALLMPSFAEGFGLPVFEALELGTPVVATDLPAYREVAGDRPTYLAADDVMAWYDVILGLSREQAVRPGPTESGFRAPTWADHFQKIDAWLQTL